MSDAPHATILTAGTDGGTYRGYLHHCEAATEREKMVRAMLKFTGREIISATHLYAVVAGPENPAFATAVAALGITAVAPCDTRIVSQAMEMLVMGEVLFPEYVADGTMRMVLETCFAMAEDWDDLLEASHRAAHSWVADALRDEPSDEVAMAISAFTGGIAVAMAKARADWTW